MTASAQAKILCPTDRLALEQRALAASIHPSTTAPPLTPPAEESGEGQESPAAVRKTFDCDKCGSKYSRAEYLRRHARKHENVYPFKCPFPNCTKEFARSDVLLRHRRRQHPNSPPLPAASLALPQGGKKLAPSPSSPPISPISPVSPYPPTGGARDRARGRRRSSGTSTYSAWGEQTLSFTPPPPAYRELSPHPHPHLSPTEPELAFPSSVSLKPPPLSLSLDTDLPALHPGSLPIVPPFQLSASYSPTSPFYSPGPPLGGLPHPAFSDPHPRSHTQGGMHDLSHPHPYGGGGGGHSGVSPPGFDDPGMPLSPSPYGYPPYSAAGAYHRLILPEPAEPGPYSALHGAYLPSPVHPGGAAVAGGGWSPSSEVGSQGSPYTGTPDEHPRGRGEHSQSPYHPQSQSHANRGAIDLEESVYAYPPAPGEHLPHGPAGAGVNGGAENGGGRNGMGVHPLGVHHQPSGQFAFVDLQKLLRERPGEYGTVGGP